MGGGGGGGVMRDAKSLGDLTENFIKKLKPTHAHTHTHTHTHSAYSTSSHAYTLAYHLTYIYD